MTISGEESDSGASHVSESSLEITDPYTGPNRRSSTKGRPRRPTLIHTKSGRSRPLSRPYEEEVVQRQYVVEDSQGHKFYYNTKEDAIAKADRLDCQQCENTIEAYQASQRAQPATLIAESSKRFTSTQQEQPESAVGHVSSSSKESTISTRLSTSESAIRIERGDDVFNIPSDRTVEIITKDGDTMIIGPGSPTREKSHHGSQESFICQICKRQFRSGSALNHDGCTFASRYPKFLKRHALTHEKRIDHQFVCREPGCDAKFTRKDNLARHYRAKHPDSVADASTGRVPSDPVTTTPPALDSSAPIDPRLVPPTFDGDQSSESELNLSTAPTSYNAALYHSSESELDISIAPTSIDAVEPDTLGEQGHSDFGVEPTETGAVEPWSSISHDPTPPHLRLSARGPRGDIMNPSRTSKPLPPSVALFEEKDKDLVFSNTPSSIANLPGLVGALTAADVAGFDIFGEPYQQILRGSWRATNAHDSDDDESSCAASVFSQESTASTATSLGGSFGTIGLLEMVNRTASALFADDVAKSINCAAVEDPGIGPERYRRNIPRMIKTFGKSLRAEAGTFAERRIAVAMQTRRISTHVAREIMMGVEGPRPRNRRTKERSEHMDEENHSDASTDSVDEDEVGLTQEPEDEAKIRNFILDSEACMQFKRTLLDFVHKPYEKRIMTALNSSLTRTASHDRIYLARVAREISWVPRKLLCFSHDQSSTVVDHFKGYVEDFMGETWNWSPFRARQHSLQTDCFRLNWKSPSGEAKYIDLPKDVEGAVRDAFDTAPDFLNQVNPSDCHTTTAIRNLAAGATSNTTPTTPLASHQAGAGKAPSHQSGPPIPSQPLGAPAPSIASGLQLCAQVTQAQQNGHHVYLCVEAGSREFVGFNCAGIRTDIQFFDRIKSEYNAARGWFRLWFSTWRYDHCEFMQFQMTGIRLGARLQIAFPAHTDQLYDYMPKPLEELQLPPHGPISPDEFRTHYYYQICPSLLSWERWHRRKTGLSQVETEAFDAAPKRVVELDMQNGRRERFYGLYAKEARSALRVAVHMSICCLPGVIFFFLWLYRWGHGADLQGAAVPVQLSLTLVAGYLGVLYWTR